MLSGVWELDFELRNLGEAMLEKTVEVLAGDDGVTLVCTVVCEEDIARTVEFDSVASPAG